MAEIQIEGLTDVLRKWEQAPNVMRREFGTAGEALLLGMAADLAKYPAPPPSSSYRRTGTLGRTWDAARPAFQNLQNGFAMQIDNATPYAGFVQGGANDKPSQAWMHKNRWQTTDDVVRAHAADAQSRFAHAIQKIIEQL